MRMGEGWYAGTADAIQQNTYILERSQARYVLVLAGDHVYRMDYARMLEEHVQRKWDVTVGCAPVPIGEAPGFGVLEVGEDHLIQAFVEKSQNPPHIPGKPQEALASMGIYVFNLSLLLTILAQDRQDKVSLHDFGRNILPKMVGAHSVGAYRFGGEEGRVAQDGYWKDVGTLDSYFQANMDLIKPIPPLNLYQTDWATRTYHGQYPSARMVPSLSSKENSVSNSLLAGGDVIIGAKINRCILSPNVRIEEGAVIEDALLFEGVCVGEGVQLRRCIIDKEVIIPPKESIGYDMKKDRSRFTVSEEGVVVVPKNYKF